MSKMDSIKEEIGVLKLLLGISAALEASLLAWMAQNSATAGTELLTGAIIGIGLVTGALLGITRRLFRRVAELEDL